MFILKSLVAALALGLAQDAMAAAAAPACCTNKCGKSVQLAKNNKKDCSAFLVKTVIPTKTTTVVRTTTLSKAVTISKTATLSRTITLTGRSTIIEEVTSTTDISVTNIASETDYSTSTSLETIEQTEVVTNTATAVETQFETTTVPYPVSTTTIVPVKKRSAPCTKPAYASACDVNAYTRACSCIGVKPSTTTKAAVIKTIYHTKTAYKTGTTTKTQTLYKTLTAYETLTTTQTSQAPDQTQTFTVSLTTYTTVISGTAITATETLTLTESATITETTVIVATSTADPVPPACIGRGFNFRVAGTSRNVNGWGMGLINSIGQGIYVRLFSGGASPFVITDGQLQSWYGSDYQYIIPDSGLPAKVWVKSARSQVTTYPYATVALSCGISDAPSYEIVCTSATTTYKTTFCQDPVYYEWVLTAYTDESQLTGKTCTNDGTAMAKCVLY